METGLVQVDIVYFVLYRLSQFPSEMTVSSPVSYLSGVFVRAGQPPVPTAASSSTSIKWVKHVNKYYYYGITRASDGGILIFLS